MNYYNVRKGFFRWDYAKSLNFDMINYIRACNRKMERNVIMEKTIEQNTYVLQEDEDLGTVKIADDVVAMIAGLAATEVEGVAAMAGNISNELMSKMGVKNLAKGVRVEVIGKRVRTYLALIVEYGYNIPAISQRVQEKVKSTVENMTGLEVSDVDIRIAGVSMQKDK